MLPVLQGIKKPAFLHCYQYSHPPLYHLVSTPYLITALLGLLNIPGLTSGYQLYTAHRNPQVGDGKKWEGWN